MKLTATHTSKKKFVFRAAPFTVLIVLIFFGVFVETTHAQNGGLGGLFSEVETPSPGLEISPTHPGSRDEVVVSLPPTLINVSGGVRWFLNGEAQTEYDNQREFSFISGRIGESMRVVAHIMGGGAIQSRLEKVITARELDIVIEGDGMTPYFYKGRTLPSGSTPVSLTAIPHTGDGTPYTEYSYKWTVDGRVLNGGGARGLYQISLEEPSARPSIVRVDVTNNSGQLVVSKTFGLVPYKPVVRFYEINPLRGTSRVAISDDIPVTSSEVTVRAEPYYFDESLLEQEHEVQWTVNRRGIDNPSDDLQEITLRNIRGDDSRAEVSFSLHSAVQLLQFVRGGFDIWFNE